MQVVGKEIGDIDRIPAVLAITGASRRQLRYLPPALQNLNSATSDLLPSYGSLPNARGSRRRCLSVQKNCNFLIASSQRICRFDLGFSKTGSIWLHGRFSSRLSQMYCARHTEPPRDQSLGIQACYTNALLRFSVAHSDSLPRDVLEKRMSACTLFGIAAAPALPFRRQFEISHLSLAFTHA